MDASRSGLYYTLRMGVPHVIHEETQKPKLRSYDQTDVTRQPLQDRTLPVSTWTKALPG